LQKSNPSFAAQGLSFTSFGNDFKASSNFLRA